MTEQRNLLTVRDLCKSYSLGGGFFASNEGTVRAVDRVSFSVDRGRTFGLVGESGSGKTTIGRMIVRVVEPDRGSILFADAASNPIDLAVLKPRQMRPLRRKIQMIFQDPYSSLDPRMTVARIIGEPLRALHGITRSEIDDRVAEVTELVGLRREFLDRYPHAFSGGQRQRIGIARALVTRPELIVADEAVSALDVSVQAQILNLMRDLQQQLGIAYLFIAHDLGVVRYLCDTVAVLYRGRIAEIAKKNDIYHAPRHPYTESLIAAALTPEPKIDAAPEPDEHAAQIHAPIQDSTVGGCLYQSRCAYRQEICARQEPALRTIVPGHTVACHFDLQLRGTRTEIEPALRATAAAGSEQDIKTAISHLV
jgi:peptide/nickel transport system ATP-binding protein